LDTNQEISVETSNVRAVLFAKDLKGVATFYHEALGMRVTSSDEYHSVLDCHGFELVVHQIPKQIADNITIDRPPKRRISGTIRLDYPVKSIGESRKAARSLGGDIDDAPPAWADRDANFYFGFDPEGNQFGVSQRA
jgi:predicted enzyme related to lactoylglutathione lyase